MDLLNVNVNDTLFINDSIDIMESISKDNGVDGYKYSVLKDEIHLKSINENNKVNILKLSRSDNKEFILHIDEKFQSVFATLYQELSYFTYLDRAQLLSQGLFCLFDEPEDTTNFNPCDLNYAKSLTLFCFNKVNSDIVDIEYRLIHDSSDYYTNIKDSIFTAIHVYKILDKETDKYFMILEEGGIDKQTGDKNPNGGFVRLFTGRDIELQYIKAFCD